MANAGWAMAQVTTVLVMLSISGPAAAASIEEVAPQAGERLPLNAQVWIKVAGDSFDPLSLAIEQDGTDREFASAEGVCCIVFNAELPEITSGPLSLSIQLPGDEPTTTTEYLVLGEEDVTPPQVGPPTLETRDLPDQANNNSVWVVAHVDVVSDDWGVAAIIPEFDSEASSFSRVDDEDGGWVSGNPLVGDEIASGEADHLFDTNLLLSENRREGCVRLVAVDVGGNRTTSDVACIALRPPSPLEWLLDVAALAGCSCSGAQGGSSGAFFGFFLVIFAKVMGRNRRSAS